MKPRARLLGFLRWLLPPRGFWLLAALLVLTYGVLHLAGFRRHTAILSGTYPANDTEVVLGLCYVAAYFACVIIAPILAIAGAILWLLQQLSPRLK